MLVSRTFSEEHKKKLSVVKLGRKRLPLSRELREKISIALLGKTRPPRSEEYRQKISAANLGEKSNFWKGGVTPEGTNIRNRREYYSWRRKVNERDNFICQHCGKEDLKSRNCISHHIKDFMKYPKLRFDVDNGLTLCRSCHTRLHRKLEL